VTQFLMKPGQQIVGIYGSFDTKSKVGMSSQLLDYDASQDCSMLSGIGFIVYSPHSPLEMTCQID